jgi:hypothetical protein
MAVQLFRSGMPKKRLIAIGSLLLVAAVSASAMQLRPPPQDLLQQRSTALRGPAGLQVCRRQAGITYCAFPDFVSRVDAWSKVVTAELAQVPPSAVKQPYFVRQRLPLGADSLGADSLGVGLDAPLDSWRADDMSAGTPDPVPVSTSWAEGGHGQFSERQVIAFATLFAHRIVTGEPVAVNKHLPVCGARGVVTLWLAAQATSGTRAALHTDLSHSSGGLSLDVANSQLGLFIDQRETDLALNMLDAPTSEIAGKVRGAWPELTAPNTTAERAGEILGLRVPALPAGYEGACP